MRIDKNTTIKLGDRNIVKIKIGDSVIWEKKTEPVDETNYFYIENTYDGGNTITFNTYKSNTPPSNSKYAKKIEYSTDKRNWNTLTFNTSTPQTITIESGEKLYLRNDSGGFNYYNFIKYYTNISASQNFVIGGNINTLINYNDADNVSLKGDYGCFYNLFYNAKYITDASNLIIPSTNITESYCREMFSGCTSLQNAPTLSATTLGKHCYNQMFSGCSKLTTAPELPATKLASYCYNEMFSSCTSLVNAPTLPATTLVPNCYYYMFGDCSKLNSITVHAGDISASDCTNRWLYKVASSGTFNNLGFAPFKTGSSGIPNGWTEVVPPIQSITANPDTFTIKSYNSSVNCKSTLTITTTTGITATNINLATITVGENTGDSTRTLTETIPYKGSSYQVTIVQTANDVRPPWSWNVVSEGTYPFQLNLNYYYESTNKEKDSSYSYATLNYSGFENLVLECINSGDANYDYGIISQPDVQLSESVLDDGATGSTNVFHNFKGQSSTNPVQITIPSDRGSHFITIKYRKDGSDSGGNDSLQFRVIEPTT